MSRNVIVAGVLAGLFVFVWYFVVNGILGFNSRINMKTLPEERLVYQTLRNHVAEPGRYAVNPRLTSDRRFPPHQPVFSVLYGGMGHEAAGRHALFSLPWFVILPLIVAWMLSLTSDRVLSSASRKVLFVGTIGLLLAVWSHLKNFGIGGYPLGDSLLMSLHDVVLWVCIGLILAWRIRPEPRERHVSG